MRIRRFILSAVFAIFLGPSLAFSQEDTSNVQNSDFARLNLVCLGAGSANQSSTETVNVWNNEGDHSWGQVVGNRPVPFDDQVNLWIEEQQGRLRMPRSMLPTIRGGEDGWFKIKSIAISENEITGSIAVNVFNNPKLLIDRITGTISISGRSGDFRGKCAPYDPDTVKRAF